MASLGTLTHAEILSQPAAWRTAIDYSQRQAREWEGWLASPVDTTWFVGCGTSFYLARAAAMAYQTLTCEDARAVPASELLLFEAGYLLPDRTHRCILISRSGTTTEMVRVAERLSGRRGIETIAITLRDNTPFTEIVDRKVLLPEVFDRSVVMTRSYSTMLLLCQILAHLRAGRKEALRTLDKLADAGERVLADAAGLADQLAAIPFRHYLFLAQGPLYGVAEEASLKMKEMSLSVSESFPSLEERHGPKSVVDDGTLVTVFTSQHTEVVETPLIQELAGLGASSLQIVENGVTGSQGNQHTFALNSGLSLWQRLPLYVLPAQLLALAVARRKGIDSDSPRALTASVDIVASKAGI